MSLKLLGPKIGYVDLFLYEMEEKIKKDHAAGKNYQRVPIRPSSSGKCARELYYELMQFSGRAKYETAHNSPETELLLNLGHSIEKHLIDNIRKYFSVCEVKYTQQVLDFGRIQAINDVNLSVHLEGSIDLCLLSDKWKCVIDVKSKGDNYDFKARKMQWEAYNDKFAKMESVEMLSDRCFWVENLDAFLVELDDPFFASNFKQLNMYLNSEFIQDRGINHGAIIQYHKSKSKLREIRFRPSKTVYQDVLNKFQNVIKAVDNNTPELAPKEYKQQSLKCRYCAFHAQCWKKDKK